MSEKCKHGVKLESVCGMCDEDQYRRRESELAPVSGSVASMPRPTIEELERMLASGEPLKIQLQPDGSILAVRPVVSAITECEGMAVMLDVLAGRASAEDHQSGQYGNWCHDAENLRSAARILKHYSEPPNEKADRP